MLSARSDKTAEVEIYAPWWIRCLRNLLAYPLSYTIGNLFYTARITNALQWSFIIWIVRCFSNKDFRPSHTIWEEQYQNQDSVTTNKHEMINGLATYQFQSKPTDDVKSTLEKARYIIYCPGTSGQCARHFEELQKLTEKTGTTTITFSHPGVGRSEGHVLDKDDLINAMYQIAKSLIDKGIKASQITLSGMSMGAAVAALTVDKVNQYGGVKDKAEGVYFSGDRTFGDFTNEVVDQTYIGRLPLLNYLLWFFIKPLLMLMNWDMQPQKAFDKMDAAKREVVHVKPRTKGNAGTWYKTLTKYFGIYEGCGDTKIRAHVSLQLAKNEKVEFKDWLVKLQQDLINEKYKEAISSIDTLICANKTISTLVTARLKDLRTKLQDPVTFKDEITSCFLEVLSAFKGARLKGIDEVVLKSSNAHDARYNQLHTRPVKNFTKWSLASESKSVDFFDRSVKLEEARQTLSSR